MGLTGTFLWAGGIEDTFIVDPHAGTGKTLDEYELIGHYGKWKGDLRAVASLGIDALRWGIPWHRVEPSPGSFSWEWVDDVLSFLIDDLHVEPLVDLIHYGTPRWLPAGFVDTGFLAAFSRYVTAFAKRYEGRVRYATPVNEPYTAAELSGRRGDWPPYRRGDAGFVAVMMAASRASAEASHILADNGYTTVHVEVATGALCGEPGCEAAAEVLTLRNELSWDLITGRVDDQHPLRGWLMTNGAGAEDLAWFQRNRAVIDIVGVNYYPQWSYVLVTRGADGGEAVLPVNGGPVLLEQHLRRFWKKYGLPMMITETSLRGMRWEQDAWLEASTAVVSRLRGAGMPLRGYTWFPLIDMIDWEYRNRPGDRMDYLMELGLWTIDRVARPGAETYRSIIAREKRASE
ncbi:MAG TPA: family 1 glycosylhydrolase, partial [Spirochaetia bacterium]